MALWLQHSVVLLVVAGAALVVVRQAVATLRGLKGGFGSCCAKGCAAQVPAEAKARTADRVVFLPVESLYRKRS